MAARSSAIAVALVGLGAAAGLAVASQKTVPGAGPSEAQLTSIAAEIDSRLAGASGAVQARARTIAQLPALPYAVGTDEKTLSELNATDLKFQFNEGETVEIGQVLTGGREKVLLRMPETMKMTVALGKPGQHLMIDRSRLIVSEVVNVEPVEKVEGQVTGAVAVSQAVSLTDLVDKLDALGTAARVELDGKVVVANKRASASEQGASTRAAALASPLGKQVSVVAEVLPPQTSRNVGMLGGAVAAALAGLVGAAVLWKRAGAEAGPAGARAAGGTPVPSNVVGGMSVAVGPGGTGLSATEAGQLGVARTEFSSTAVPIVGGGERGSAPRLSSDMRAQTAGPGGRFGRYKLLKQLGAGGMAEVYLATISGEAGFEKQVALKIMHASLASQEKVVDLFLDEARIVSRLTHPNIVQISDLGKDGNDYFIAMEFVDGWDLDKLVRTARARGEHVPLRVGLTVLRKICDGLHAAHTAVDAEGKPLELVHRDVKAENVLLSRSGAVKVGDFGIAKANQQVHKTQLGELKGTAAYMAPEHRTGQAVDKRADIYGVGAIAYEVLTGNEVNLDLAMLAHLGREGWPHLPPPTSIRPDLPPELDAIVFRALAYDKDARYPTCESFEEALEAVGSRYGLTASDKVVAQWVESVIASAPAAAGTGAA